MSAPCDMIGLMSLTQWLKKIGEKEMPAFRKTASEVTAAANSAEAGAEALGKLILQDPALTARVLKMCNSAFYNSTGKPITTVSRAVLVLGVDTVRALCISLTLMETLLSGKRQERVLADLGMSLHAAMQARAFAIALRESAPEEVFIAALLYRVGNLVFWCFAEEEGIALEAMLKPGVDELTAEKAVLGFSLAHLSRVLIEDWKLSPLLLELFKGHRSGVAAESIQRGWEFAKLVEKGWTDPAIGGYVDRVASWLRIDAATAGTNLAHVAREAKKAALLFGSPLCASAIPVPDSPEEEDGTLFAMTVMGDPDAKLPGKSAPGQSKVRTDLLLACLRELTRMSASGHFSPMFQEVLKGIHEGLGFERVVFATMVPGSDTVQGRSALGLEDNRKADQFKFAIRRQMADSLSRAMEHGVVVENLRDPTKRPAVVPETLNLFIDGSPFLFGPVLISGRVVGAFYCDNHRSGSAFSADMIEGFHHLLQQLNLLLTQAAAMKATAT